MEAGFIDFRSDTVTRPTQAMRQAMFEAPVGDDVYGDDPTVNRLEAEAARLLGKEAAIFMPSGVMANEASIMAQTRPGDEIIAGANSHVIHYECGGPARLSGVSAALAGDGDGLIHPGDVRRLTRPAGNVHFPRTTLLCLENALGNGGVVPLELMKELRQAALENGLRVHLDGARLFNAALALGCRASDLAAQADSVSFCLSKGLCAPAGSMVCGPAPFIDEVRRCRKLLGGGMRQVGVLAACGLVALQTMVARLQEDHDNAKALADRLSAIDGLEVATGRVKINMVFWRASRPGFGGDEFVAFMRQRGILLAGPEGGWYRLVTHYGIDRQSLDTFMGALGEYIAGIRG